MAITDLTRQIKTVAVWQADVKQEHVHDALAEDGSGRREIVRLDKRGRADLRIRRTRDDRSEQGAVGRLVLHMQDESLAPHRRFRQRRRCRANPSTKWPPQAMHVVRHQHRCPW